MMILAVPLQAAFSAPVLSGWWRKYVSARLAPLPCARGLAVCPQQPGLTATDRDVPRGRYRAGRSGNGLCASSWQRSTSARPQRKSQYELDLLRQRSLAARYEKARRGEL